MARLASLRSLAARAAGSGKTALVAAVGAALYAVHADPSLVLTPDGRRKLALGAAVVVWNAITAPAQASAGAARSGTATTSEA
jgi:hypothetical protein